VKVVADMCRYMDGVVNVPHIEIRDERCTSGYRLTAPRHSERADTFAEDNGGHFRYLRRRQEVPNGSRAENSGFTPGALHSCRLARFL
ncbi:hypothetical protein LSAT2_029256, partial [Lamellibrachia satsuma]